MHAVVGKAVAALGSLILFSALFVNPWVGVYYQDYIDNYRDVMLGYLGWSLGLGTLLVTLGLIAVRLSRERWTGAAMAVGILSLAVIADRALLVYFGLPYWISDTEIGYRHRPNAVRIHGSRLLPSVDSRLRGVRTELNEYGYHDHSFPVEKPPGQLRGLLLGDSVTMGYGVTRDSTSAGQLEIILNTHGRGHSSYQIINTGVEGYSTNQQYITLRRAVGFAPDFAIVGFCLNDITDPIFFDAGLASAGRIASIVRQADAMTDYLANETGFSRLIAWTLAPAQTMERRSLSQEYNVRAMVEAPTETGPFAGGWALVRESLESIYSMGREQNIKIILLIFPFTFQLFEESLQYPQRVLLAHAQQHGAHAIDLTPDYETAIQANAMELISGLDRAAEMEDTDTVLVRDFLTNRYFFDGLHPTPMGNRLAAGRLAEYLSQVGLVDLNLPSFRREQRQRLMDNPGEFTLRMSHSPQSAAQTGYILFLLGQEIEKIRRVFDLGLKAATTPVVRTQLYRALGEIERAMGYGDAAAATLRRAAQQSSGSVHQIE